MSLATTFPAAILETILTRLAALFLIGAAGGPNAARQAALQMLSAYRPETEDELRLAVVIGFSFQALEALGQAAAPDLPITRTLRLRSGAVSLNRACQKAERRLDQLQTARRQDVPKQSAERHLDLAQSEPKIEKAITLVEEPRDIASVASSNDQTWTQAYEQRQREARITASLKRAEARVAAQPAIATFNTTPGHQGAVFASAHLSAH